MYDMFQKKLSSRIEKYKIEIIELEDISLKSKYTKSYLDDNSKNKTMLKHLLNCINMDLDDVMDYWNLSSEADKTNFNEYIFLLFLLQSSMNHFQR